MKKKNLTYIINNIENADDRILLDKMLNDIENISEIQDIIKIQSASDELTEWKQFDSKKAWNGIKPRKSNFSILKYASAAIVIIALGLSFLFLQNNKVEYIASDTNLHLLLEDGSDIVLAPNSKISILSDFNSNERRISLDGDAYFHVAKDSDKPFIIDMDKGEIEVLGTVFYIEQKEEVLSVALESGKVKLVDNKGNKVILNDNEMATIKDEIITADVNSFKGKEDEIADLVFDNVTIKEAINTINGIYAKEIIKFEEKNSELANQTIHTTVKNSSVSEFINGLTLMFNVRVVNSKGQFIISELKYQ